MKIRTHYLMAKIALYRLKKENKIRNTNRFREQLFCIGTVLPDLSVTQFIHRHFYEHSGNYVINKVKKLVHSKSAWSMLEYSCHFNSPRYSTVSIP